MAPDLSFLIKLWRQRAIDRAEQARRLGPTFAGMKSLGEANATRQCLDELLAALGRSGT